MQGHIVRKFPNKYYFESALFLIGSFMEERKSVVKEENVFVSGDEATLIAFIRFFSETRFQRENMNKELSYQNQICKQEFSIQTSIEWIHP